jgi:hypothetical protein
MRTITPRSPPGTLGPKTGRPTHRHRPKTFFLGMSLLIAAIVAFGFGQTLEARLIDPPSPRPTILYVHIALFVAWVLLFISQAMLVRIGRINWHRRLGILGVAVGAAMPFVGIATALTMTRLNAGQGAIAVEDQAFLALSFFDMLAFGAFLLAAVRYRKRPEYHRRLMLIATCGLTVAAFARFPSGLIPDNTWYLGVDALIVVGVVRDLLAEGRVHIVYAFGLPAVMLGQSITMWAYLTRSPAWLAMVRLLLH